jgi:hypothetical protein
MHPNISVIDGYSVGFIVAYLVPLQVPVIVAVLPKNTHDGCSLYHTN